MLNLDTHILLFSLAGDLRPKEKHFLTKANWGISAIVLWEISKLHQLGRINIGLDDGELLSVLRNIEILPISLDVCRCISELDFKSDPADEIIAATSIAYGLPLLTRDEKIRQSKLVPFVK